MAEAICDCFGEPEFVSQLGSDADFISMSLGQMMRVRGLCDVGKRRFLAMCLFTLSTNHELGTNWVEGEMTRICKDLTRKAN
jgi:hypothetical protein